MTTPRNSTFGNQNIEVVFKLDQHKSTSILSCILRSLFKKDEKLSFCILKLFDCIMDKAVPNIMRHMLFNSVSKLIQSSLPQTESFIIF